MDKVGDGGLSRRAGDADELHVLDGVAVISVEQAGLEAAAFFRRFGRVGLGFGLRGAGGSAGAG